jgi:hypothetical protein
MNPSGPHHPDLGRLISKQVAHEAEAEADEEEDNCNLDRRAVRRAVADDPQDGQSRGVAAWRSPICRPGREVDTAIASVHETKLQSGIQVRGREWRGGSGPQPPAPAVRRSGYRVQPIKMSL